MATGRFVKKGTGPKPNAIGKFVKKPVAGGGLVPTFGGPKVAKSKTVNTSNHFFSLATAKSRKA